jgi:hypothetical protein
MKPVTGQFHGNWSDGLKTGPVDDLGLNRPAKLDLIIPRKRNPIETN